MSKIVARMQKMKVDNLVGIGNHNQRRSKNHSNKEIDKNKSYLNYDLLGDRAVKNYKKDILDYINENKSSDRALRKDAVVISEWIITSDKKFFDSFVLKEDIRLFFEIALEYFSNRYGAQNIKYATVHMDETTPHMHLGIVPFTKDYKLSCKTLFTRQTLREIQDELFQKVNERRKITIPIIERGKENSDAKHLTVKEFKEKQEVVKSIKTLNSQRDKLIDTVIEKNKRSSMLEMEILDLTKQKRDLEKEFQLLKNEFYSMKSDYNRIMKLKKEEKDLQKSISNKECNLKILDKHIEDSKIENKSLSAQLFSLKRYEEYNQNIDTLGLDVDVHLKDIEIEYKNIKPNIMGFVTLNTNLWTKLKYAIDYVFKYVDYVKNKLIDAEQRAYFLENDKGKLSKKNNELNEKVKELKQKVEELNDKGFDYRTKIMDVNQKLEKQEEYINNIRNVLSDSEWENINNRIESLNISKKRRLRRSRDDYGMYI